MITFEKLMKKKKLTETDKLLIQAIATLSTQPKFSRQTPEEVFETIAKYTKETFNLPEITEKLRPPDYSSKIQITIKELDAEKVVIKVSKIKNIADKEIIAEAHELVLNEGYNLVINYQLTV